MYRGNCSIRSVIMVLKTLRPKSSVYFRFTFNVVTLNQGGPPNVCEFDLSFEQNSLSSSTGLQITNLAEPALHEVIIQNVEFEPYLGIDSSCIWQNYAPENINVS